MKEKLTIEKLTAEAKAFCIAESKIKNVYLFGVTDGKAVGTHIEHKFQEHLNSKYETKIGSSALGIDLPSVDILTDIKVTSMKQPQSSCPFKDAKQEGPLCINNSNITSVSEVVVKEAPLSANWRFNSLKLY